MSNMMTGLLGPTAGGIRVSGTHFIRRTEFLFGLISFKQPYNIVGKAVDWAVHDNWHMFKQRVKEDKGLKVNLYAAYAAPGLCKPLYKPNDGGRPYTDNKTLARNSRYWEQVDKRVRYAAAHGISVIIANTFVDQGITRKYPISTLRDDWTRTVQRYRKSSALFFPLSEYDEHGSDGVNLGLELARVTNANTQGPVSLHPIKSCGKHSGHVDFITHQGWSVERINLDKRLGKPIIVVEDQKAGDDPGLKIARFKQARALGVTYVFTGSHSGWSEAEKQFLRSL